MALPPLAVGAVLDETPGVIRSQLVQTGDRSLLLRLDLKPEADHAAWQDATARLTAYLAGQGANGVSVARASETPERSTTSGKFRQVIARPPSPN